MRGIIVEIRSAEGGEDSKLLVRDQLKIYSKFCIRRKL
jgi:protein subunit release factor A